MSTPVRLACQSEVVEIPLTKILPMRRIDDSIRKTVKYGCIEASVRELGLIEPLVVFPQPNGEAFLLLDGVSSGDGLAHFGGRKSRSAAISDGGQMAARPRSSEGC
jgi:hypothetical protein